MRMSRTKNGFVQGERRGAERRGGIGMRIIPGMERDEKNPADGQRARHAAEAGLKGAGDVTRRRVRPSVP